MYYDEKEYFDAVEKHEEAEKEANKVTSETMSFIRGKLPLRSLTKEDLAVYDKREAAWQKVLEIAIRPLPPTT